MGFEYLYAYQENLKWGIYICLGIGVVTLLIGIVLRFGNEIDTDDWLLLMGGAFVWSIFFGLLALSPSMEHIKQIRNEALTQTEKINETPSNLNVNSTNFLYEISNPGICGTDD